MSASLGGARKGHKKRTNIMSASIAVVRVEVDPTRCVAVGGSADLCATSVFLRAANSVFQDAVF